MNIKEKSDGNLSWMKIFQQLTLYDLILCKYRNTEDWAQCIVENVKWEVHRANYTNYIPDKGDITEF